MGELFERVRPVWPLEWTGELLTMDTTGRVEVEHFHRYLLARHLTRGLDVLDIASGDGYGSALIAQTAHSVIGVEIDRVAVEQASGVYVAHNLRFMKGSAQLIPLPDQSVDCVVSFETIEHSYDQKQFLKEIRRVLRTGGRLIISSPDRKVYSPQGGPSNQYHIRELTRNEFEKFLRSSFEYVTFLGQRPIVGSVMVREIGYDGPSDSMTFERLSGDRFKAVTGLDHPLYHVAFASDIPLPSLPESFYFERGSVEDAMVTLPALRLEHQRLQESLRVQIDEQMQTTMALEAAIKGERSRAKDLAAEIESLRARLLGLTNPFGFRLGSSLRRITSWSRYDAAYQVWKEYRKKRIERHEALKMIGDEYGVRLFFILYPLYKTVKPLWKLKSILAQTIGHERKGNPGKHTARKSRLGFRPEFKIDVRGTFDPSKRTMLLVSHDAFQHGAQILAFNLLEKFAPRYNVISVLLGPGALENAFRNMSFATIGPLPEKLRLTDHIHEPILNACRKFAPAFAIVNSIASREALIPLSRAGVPSVLLVHEFVSVFMPLDMPKIVSSAGQMVFSARRVWEDAVAVFPPLAGRPANIITQGPSRIPREWLDGKIADDEGKRVAEVMRPLGVDDNRVVVIGCGTVDLRKGVDLFISVAAALQKRLPSRRFRFVWVGKEVDHIYSRFLATQVDASGLHETMTFLEEVNSLEPVYALADIFLLSSRLDPFPNVAIDSMLAGLPVVCFENGSGVADMLSNHAGLKRLVVPYADASSAAEVIEQLSLDDFFRQTTKAAIRDLALSTFDMDRYVERLEKVTEKAALIRMQEEDDFATISRSDAFVVEYAAPPGFSGPRDDYVKNFVRASSCYGSNRRPFPGFHHGIYRNANPELNDPPFVNPLAHFIRNGQPQGPWLLDIIKPERSPSAQDQDQRVALHFHIHYPGLASELFRPLTVNETRLDIFVTASSDEGLHEITETAAKLRIAIKDIMIVPNRGRDVGPLLTLLGRRLIKDYEIVGHLHAKKTSSFPEHIGAVWRTFCVENLLGGKHAMMDLILDRFARNPKLGLVFPCDPNIIGWTLNRPPAEILLERMGIAANLPEHFFFPVGTMFWARTNAIAPLLELDLSWNDYPSEPLPYDGTILHAIERLFPVVAQHRGFEIAGTYVPGFTR
ncbi:MAG: rhamnan synthesis F family protein [Syntrophobacteraceae bacterium]